MVPQAGSRIGESGRVGAGDGAPPAARPQGDGGRHVAARRLRSAACGSRPHRERARPACSYDKEGYVRTRSASPTFRTGGTRCPTRSWRATWPPRRTAPASARSPRTFGTRTRAYRPTASRCSTRSATSTRSWWRPYAEDFLKLLNSKNNRLVWGGMIALATVAELKADVVFAHLEEIKQAMQHGSVITVDNGVLALARAASRSDKFSKAIFPLPAESPEDLPPQGRGAAFGEDPRGRKCVQQDSIRGRAQEEAGRSLRRRPGTREEGHPAGGSAQVGARYVAGCSLPGRPQTTESAARSRD